VLWAQTHKHEWIIYNVLIIIQDFASISCCIITISWKRIINLTCHYGGFSRVDTYLVYCMYQTSSNTQLTRYSPYMLVSLKNKNWVHISSTASADHFGECYSTWLAAKSQLQICANFPSDWRFSHCAHFIVKANHLHFYSIFYLSGDTCSKYCRARGSLCELPSKFRSYAAID
jgi:hypothetical protein